MCVCCLGKVCMWGHQLLCHLSGGGFEKISDETGAGGCQKNFDDQNKNVPEAPNPPPDIK